MSKKIIYLLSLLMALSLVFASCKKNSITDALGGLQAPPDTSTGEDVAGEDGLFRDYNDIPSQSEIANIGVFVTTDGNYYRNPVIVARSDGKVYVFVEKRYKSKGSGNDVGIDGDAVTDIVYKVSTDGGYNFGTQEYKVGKSEAAATNPGESYGAPVVFVDGNNIVVVGTSGSGIGRSTKTLSDKGDSKISYISGTFGDAEKITWSSDWTEISEVTTLTKGTSKLVDIVKATPSGGYGSGNFEQYGTQPSRGVVVNSTMYLDVVLAKQGTLNDVYELMGRMTIKASISSPASGWSVVEDPVGYTDGNQLKLGPWKETKLISAGSDGSTLQHLIVPSPWTTGTKQNALAIAAKDQGPSSFTKTTIRASEGAPGFYATADKWFGNNPYKIEVSGDKVTGISQADSGQSPVAMGILVHVKQTASQLYLYRVDKDNLTPKGNGLKLDNVGKSSSVDMLPDGTIVVAAEKGGETQNYFIRFLRYSQAYLENQAK